MAIKLQFTSNIGKLISQNPLAIAEKYLTDIALRGLEDIMVEHAGKKVASCYLRPFGRKYEVMSAPPQVMTKRSFLGWK